MRHNTPKRAKHDRDAKPERDAYREEFHLCQVCCRRPADTIHEIARGVHRKDALKERCTWLLVCHYCHIAVEDYSKWPLTKQLACKLLTDSDGFDLQRFNEIRDRAPEAITLADVVRHFTLQ